MLNRTSLAIASRSAAVLLLGGIAAGGCSQEPEPPGVAALRALFPAQADTVLAGAAPVGREHGGFVLQAARRARAGAPALRARLPRDGGDALRLVLPGFEALVHERDLQGEGAVSGESVAYRRAGGTSFWTAVPGGAEEWLLLDAEMARGDRVAASWSVTGATVRERSGSVELVDGAGAARVKVTAPRAYARGGRPIEAKLAVRGDTIDLLVDGGGEAVLVDPEWTSTSAMVKPREHHAATRLVDGRVLVAGGAGYDPLASAEVYDPATGAFSPVAPMHNAQVLPVAARLPGGRVLVAGGGNSFGPQKTAEIYDPSTNTWTVTGSLNFRAIHRAAVVLKDGRVLVPGGYEPPVDPIDPGARHKEVDIFDAATGTWSLTTPMGVARADYQMALLVDGRVLVIGGEEAPTAEVYDPATATWTPTGPLHIPKMGGTAVRLPNGSVLAVGSHYNSPAANAEIYDPATNAWTETSPFSFPLPGWYHSASPLGNGNVLVVEGVIPLDYYVKRCEIYDPLAGTWTQVDDALTSRVNFMLTPLQSGAVLLTGGYEVYGAGYLPEAELFDNGSGAFPPEGTGGTGGTGSTGSTGNVGSGGAPGSSGSPGAGGAPGPGEAGGAGGDIGFEAQLGSRSRLGTGCGVSRAGPPVRETAGCLLALGLGVIAVGRRRRARSRRPLQRGLEPS